MTTKHFLYILLVFICIVFSSAKSIDNESSSEEALSSNKVFSALSPKDQLLFFTLDAFEIISHRYIDHAANISKLLLQDDVLKAGDSEMFKEFRNNITEFLNRYNKIDNVGELFNLVEVYSNTTSDYYEIDKKTATTDMLTIESKLKKYGSEDLDKDFEKQFIAFVDRFYVKFDEFKSKISKEDIEKEQEMINWLEDFKVIQNVEEKIMSFEKFFQFYTRY